MRRMEAVLSASLFGAGEDFGLSQMNGAAFVTLLSNSIQIRPFGPDCMRQKTKFAPSREGKDPDYALPESLQPGLPESKKKILPASLEGRREGHDSRKEVAA